MKFIDNQRNEYTISHFAKYISFEENTVNSLQSVLLLEVTYKICNKFEMYRFTFSIMIHLITKKEELNMFTCVQAK